MKLAAIPYARTLHMRLDLRPVQACRKCPGHPCDCNHSTGWTDGTLPGDFSPGFCGSPRLEAGLSTASNLNLGGDVTATESVYFFLGVSVLSLIVAVFFARQVIGSDIGTPDMQRIAAAIKKGAEAFLKRQYKTVAAVLAGPAASHIRLRAAGTRGRRRSQPDAAGFVDREFFRHERTCPSDDRIAVLRRRPVVRPDDLCAVEEPAGSSHHARNLRTDL